jgi:hypothetical protein
MSKPSNAQLEWLEKLAAMGGAAPMAAPLAGSLNLPDGQQMAQGDFVSEQAAKLVSKTKIPSAKEAAEKYQAKQKPKPPATEDDSMPATKFERSKSAVDEDDGSLRADVEYKKLPSALQAKLSHQFWHGLKMTQRGTLVETYRRLKQDGVWDYINRVTGEKEHPEKHVKLFGFEFETDGNSGGITYEATDALGLMKKLRATGHYGEDGKLMGFMHRGQSSYREQSQDPDDPRGAHVSIGPRKRIDAHIDKHPPVGQPVDGKTRIDPAKAYEHGTKELIPEFVRKGVKFVTGRGIPLKPAASIKENREGWHGGEFKIGVEIELRGPVKKEKPKLRGSPTSADPVDQEVQERIAKRVERTKNIFPISVGTRPAEVPENKAFATILAAEIVEAARSQKTSVQLNMAYYLDKQVDQPAALKVIHEIGLIVRSELGEQAGKVKLLKMTFGSMSQKGNISLVD